MCVVRYNPGPCSQLALILIAKTVLAPVERAGKGNWGRKDSANGSTVGSAVHGGRGSEGPKTEFPILGKKWSAGYLGSGRYRRVLMQKQSGTCRLSALVKALICSLLGFSSPGSARKPKTSLIMSLANALFLSCLFVIMWLVKSMASFSLKSFGSDESGMSATCGSSETLLQNLLTLEPRSYFHQWKV